MADLNTGKFQGLDENAKNNYADSFIGATKVAEKVKKGGSEKTSDGYVVDAIDIDWGGLTLTTISDKWSYGLQIVTSTEQNAGKGDNTQGIHSTAYLLNKISNSFTQIYNEIGGTDEAGLRLKIKDLEKSIEQITGSNPGQLADIRDRIQKIEQELDNPGAASTLVTILDSLDGFDKTKGGVKSYINDQDKAILGTATDEATAYTVYGVRKYVDTTAKENLIGSTADASTVDTIWGAKNYANTTVKNSLIGKEGDQTIDTHYGVKFLSYYYTDDAIDHLMGSYTDVAESETIYGVRKYTDEKFEALSNTAFKVSRIEEGDEGILVFSTVSYQQLS